MNEGNFPWKGLGRQDILYNVIIKKIMDLNQMLQFVSAFYISIKNLNFFSCFCIKLVIHKFHPFSQSPEQFNKINSLEFSNHQITCHFRKFPDQH